jgi:hypothetical protein
MIGEMWRALPKDEKEIWKLRQARAKREHQEIWPEYKYDPVQPREKEQKQDVPVQNGTQAQLPNLSPAAATFLETEEGFNLLKQFTYENASAAPAHFNANSAANNAP